MTEQPLSLKRSSEFHAVQVRQEFPILSREVYGKPLTYLDNAASAQKPKVVIDSMNEVLENEYANVHRGLHYLSNTATAKYEEARAIAQRFLNAASQDEIIFTSGATDGINLVANGLAEDIKEGDEIVLSIMEHHSNIVPWHFLRERHGAVLKWVDIESDGSLSIERFEEVLSSRTKLVALTHMSNVLGTVTPVKDIIQLAHDRGVPVLLDGAQGAVHLDVDVQDLDVDFYACTGHKLYGPTGIGILYGKKQRLNALRPFRGGGEMIEEVSRDRVTYLDAPHRFEAGTPPIVEAIGLGAALTFMMSLDAEAVRAHEHALLSYAMECLRELNSIQTYGSAPGKGSIVAFNLEGAHPHDLSTIIDREGVAVRAGHHCAQPLMERLGVTATARASFALYNTMEDVDRLVAAIRKAGEFLS